MAVEKYPAIITIKKENVEPRLLKREKDVEVSFYITQNGSLKKVSFSEWRQKNHESD